MVSAQGEIADRGHVTDLTLGMDPDPARDRLRAFLESGGSVVGQVAGAAAASFAGTEAATGAAAVLGETMSRIGGELADRLHRREGARAAGALAVAKLRIDERLDAGHVPRGEGFFDVGDDGRIEAEELLEGTLLGAARAWERRKVELLGRLFANAVFTPHVASPHASYLVGIVERMTYRQLVLLAVVAEAQIPGSEYEAGFVVAEAALSTGVTSDSDVVLELNDMSDMRLVGIRQNDGSVAPPFSTYGSAGGWVPSTLIRADLMPVGRTLHELLEPQEVIPREELDDVFGQLVRRPG